MGGLSLEACGSHLGSLSGSARPSYDPLSSITATADPVFPSRLVLRQRCRKVTQGPLSVLRYRSTEATNSVVLGCVGTRAEWNRGQRALPPSASVGRE